MDVESSNFQSEATTRTLGTVVKYRCLEGFAQVGGSNTLECMDSDGKGVWFGDRLQCEGHNSSGTEAT